LVYFQIDILFLVEVSRYLNKILKKRAYLSTSKEASDDENPGTERYVITEVGEPMQIYNAFYFLASFNFSNHFFEIFLWDLQNIDYICKTKNVEHK